MLCEACGEKAAVSVVESEKLCQPCIDDWLGIDLGISEEDNKKFNEALSKANVALMEYEAVLKSLEIPASLDVVYEDMNYIYEIATEEGYVIE